MMGEGDALRMFERKHMAAIMLHLRANGGSSTRMRIYNEIANNDHMPDKFALLEEAGLLIQTKDRFTRAVTLTLTEKGARVADALADLDALIREGRWNHAKILRSRSTQHPATWFGILSSLRPSGSTDRNPA